MHCLTSSRQWVVQLLHWLRHSGQWNFCNAQFHCLLAMGSGTPAIHCLTAWGPWIVELLQYTVSLLGGMGSGTLVTH